VSDDVPPSVVSDGADPIGARLRQPARHLHLAELHQAWYRHRLRVVVPWPAGFVPDVGLPGRLRGAMGQRLLESASDEAREGRPCPWRPASALDPLFVARRIGASLEAPKPLLPSVTAAGRELVFTCDLFGFATAWSDVVAEAMVAALRAGLLDGEGRRWAFTPAARLLDELQGFDLPPAGAVAVVFQFATPLCLRRRQGEAGAGAPLAGPLLASIANRVSGMARWHDSGIEADWRSLAARWHGLAEDPGGLRAVTWGRVSHRQGGRAVPMAGVFGTFLASGVEADLALLVALGATVGAGSHTALGLGRYTPAFVVPEPG